MTTQELLELIDSLRARGVLHYKQGDLELTLNPLPPSLDDDTVDDEPPGWKGLTREEEQLLGVVRHG